ncbi:MAG: phosphatase PAP2 family protein [Oscillatoria princeps RMCB-10]|jgi:membrane-associated phospholipid phosphatase|nr:phosphatase PAP2 family protein [Oscillatoria princeps RMCB-10]
MSVQLFDPDFYATGNPDLAAAGITTPQQLLQHFQTQGLSEHRQFSPFADLNFYRAKNPDLASLTNEQLFNHLEQFGVAENRQFSPLIDLNFYRASNPDLAGLNSEQLLKHLQTFGIAEGRAFSPYVSLDYYLSNNPDVNQACTGNRNLALQHLQTHGIAEGRSCSPAFKFDRQLNRFLSADPTNTIIDWNQTALNAIQTDKTAPPLAARNLAIIHTAIYDAVTAIAKTGTPYKANLEAPPNADPEAAAAAAAHRTLTYLYPNQSPTFDAALTSSLAAIPDSKSETDGVTIGQIAAGQILAARSADGSATKVPHTPKTSAGNWIPTPPGFQPALLPQWANLAPFAMTSNSQFRPSEPPPLTSSDYTRELNQVKELGEKNSSARTPEGTEIALFWADGAGTYTPPGHWNQIAQQASLQSGSTLLEDARMFALLNIALADAGIVAWDAKYAYDFWRPVTAIRQADTDGNPQTAADITWDSLIGTPPFPEYISGHSTFSGAADAVLTELFGDNFNFTTTSIGLPGVERQFDSFSDAASEAGLSRIYGGIHFLSANEDGLAAGRSLGDYVVENFLTSNAPDSLG